MQQSKHKRERPWLQHYGHIPHTLDYPDISLWEIVEKSANKYTDKIALDYFGTKVSYSELFVKIEECAKALKVQGFKQNDTITVCMPNSIEGIVSIYAINMIKARADVIHPLTSENEIMAYMINSGSKGIIVIDSSLQKAINLTRKAKELRDIPIIYVKANDSMKWKLQKYGYELIYHKKRIVKQSNVISYKKAFLQRANLYERDKHGDYKIRGKGSDESLIFYSGGSAGNPKPIILTNYNINAFIYQATVIVADCLVPGDTMLGIIPIFHGFGFAMNIHTAIHLGVTVPLMPKYDRNLLSKIFTNYKINIIAGVPTLYEKITHEPLMESVDYSGLKVAISGGSYLSPTKRKKFESFLHSHGASSELRIREGYGGTETVTGTCFGLNHISKEGSIGVPFPDTDYKIVKPGTQEELPVGEVGETCVSSPTVMVGYLNNKVETDKALQTHDDGMKWYHSGDLGFIDNEGFYHLKGREKDIIITSGYNVEPSSIENVLDTHDSVAETVALGVNDDVLGEKVVVIVKLKDSGMHNKADELEVLKKELYDLCKLNVPKYALPKEIKFRVEFPMTLMSKTDRRKLLEEENADKTRGK
ncbi:MAG: AMP-binding protein [Oscillospiraceae bacterium]|nr:AMP-binding protein [Oscillospiraceae bacterium]